MLIEKMLDTRLAALQHPRPTSVNVYDRVSFANTVLWLEDEKIQYYNKNDRAGLRNIKNMRAWEMAYQQYKFDIGVPTFKNRSEELLWLLGYAVKLQFLGHNVHNKRFASVSNANNQTDDKDLEPTSNENNENDAQLKDFIKGIRLLAKKLNIAYHPDHLTQLEAIARVLHEATSPDEHKRVLNAEMLSNFCQERELQTDDPVLESAARILQLLQEQSLHKLHTLANETLDTIQKDRAPRAKVISPTKKKPTLKKQNSKPDTKSSIASDANKACVRSRSYSQSLDQNKRVSPQSSIINPNKSPHSLLINANNASDKGPPLSDKSPVISPHCNPAGRTPSGRLATVNRNDSSLSSLNNSSIKFSPRPSKSVLFMAPSHKEIIKVGVVPYDFPAVTFNLEQQKAVEAAVLNELRKLPENGPQIRFRGCHFRAGWLTMICADRTSRNWLSETVRYLKPWDDAKLRLIEKGELPKKCVATANFPGTNLNGIEILRTLRLQNRSLPTKEWKVLRRTVHEQMTHLTIMMEEHSARLLEELNCNPFYGLNRVQFQIKKYSFALPSKRQKITKAAKPPCTRSMSSNPRSCMTRQSLISKKSSRNLKQKTTNSRNSVNKSLKKN